MTDVLIIGGGVVGCAVAVHLLRDDPTLDTVVVEPDPTYTFAATLRASGGVRQLFTRPENVLLSQYTLEVVRDWAGFARTDGADLPDLAWKRQGYLFISGPGQTQALRANLETQLALGVRAEWLEPVELRRRFPAIATGDLAGAVLSPDDGWLDPHGLLQGLRGKARHLGARFVQDRVHRLVTAGSRVDAAVLDSGAVTSAGAVVDAAGTWAAGLAAQVGMPVPVEPMRRFEHYVEVPTDLSGLPFVKDEDGLAVRPEGPGLSVGLVDFDQLGGFDPPGAPDYFEERVWPALARRLPVLDRLRLRSTTVGYYDQNRLDGNAVLGNWPGHLDNFYLACGFSGHGLMHALGVGRGLAELILHGRYLSIDLGRLGYGRVVENAPYAELGVR